VPAEVVDRRSSATWPGAAPAVSVVVATYHRPHYLRELVRSLEQQDLPPDDYEVVIVDNGSTDETWATLEELVEASPRRFLVLRVASNAGPAPGRNAGVAETRAPIVAFTDDDCIPTPGWLRHVRLAFVGDADVVQGAVAPDPADEPRMGPWDHTKRIRRPTPFFETCNVAYRRTSFDRAGGFDEDDPLLHPASGRAFGEDACLAWAVQANGGRAAFASRALVHHRCVPSTYARWLADQRELAGFPGLARRSPLVAGWLHQGIFLNRASQRFDLAVVGVGLALLTRRPARAALALPWLYRRWRDAQRLADGSATLGVLLRLAGSDAVALAAMAKGSAEHRRLVL
jgi:GT2 family glycosyltransferase